MVLYFSGTGNSAYVAGRIGAETGDAVLDLFEKIRSQDTSELRGDRPWVVVTPTYAWRIPRIVRAWLERTSFTGSRDVYFVLTCGGSIGNAGRDLEALCAEKKLNDRGCLAVPMPENYIAMFATPERAAALETIRQAEGVIDQAVLHIRRGEPFPRPRVTVPDRLRSGIVNAVFYPMFVHAKKFYATDACISCGNCVRVCPLGNVRLENGAPAWGNRCTHCMACICRCPTEAIEYGSHSKGQPRYVCPKTGTK